MIVLKCVEFNNVYLWERKLKQINAFPNAVSKKIKLKRAHIKNPPDAGARELAKQERLPCKMSYLFFHNTFLQN